MTVAPSYAASSGEHSRSRSARPKLVELPNKVGGVLEVGGYLPGGCVVTFPLNEVLEAVVIEAAVQDGLNLPLLLAIDNDSWRWWRYLPWVRVIGGKLQERNVKDWVDLDGGW